MGEKEVKGNVVSRGFFTVCEKGVRLWRTQDE